MDETLRQLVRQRAEGRCEYCQVPENLDEFPFHIDHIISRKQRGLTVESNLALSCFSCNAYKGPLTSLVIPETGELVRLFHPRHDQWADHFRWSGATLLAKTAEGRATIDMLCINLYERIAFRNEIRQQGAFPQASKPR